MTTRIITIVCRASNDFDIFEGESYVSRLCWDEMLGSVAELTHPRIGAARYSLMTREQHEDREALYRIQAWRREVDK